MKISFTDKHVLITGGSEGIGLALAERFLGDGASVTLLARNLDKLKTAESELKAAHPNGTVRVASADVAISAQIKDTILRIESEYGRVDVAVCNAGLAIPKLMVDQTLEEAERVMQVNYFGAYYTAHALLPGMIARGKGHLCFISSMAYVNPMAGFTSYSPSKAAVRHMADCLRSEVSGTGVTISVGYPPDTETPGFSEENKSKSGVVHAIMASEHEVVHSPQAVAKSLFSGLKSGAYHLSTPVLFHRLGLSLVAGITPRPLWLILEMFLAPILVLVAVISQTQQDKVVKRWRAEQLSEDSPTQCPTQPATSSPKTD
eukprot:jgi/Ulvmu1/6934/UM032_0012.1